MLDEALPTVQSPSRYLGLERNLTRKPWDSVEIRVALAFPDAYEIGMSHLGFRILYSLLNRKDGVAAERVFAPWPDLEAALRDRALPLYSLETKRPLGEFEMIGFSLQYEMTLSNILTMLDLSDIPLRSADRAEDDWRCVYNGKWDHNRAFDLIIYGLNYWGDRKRDFFDD